MTKSIELSKAQWSKLKEQLKKDYPPSALLIREKMKKQLGFVERTHRWTEEVLGKHGQQNRLITVVMLDFYSEKKCTWFLMKYGEFINE